MIDAVCERIVRHNRPDLVSRARYLDTLLNNELKDLIPKDASIVQLGCACGYMLDVFKTHGFTNLLGVDNDPDMEKDWIDGVKFVCSTARWALQTLPKPDVLLFHRFLYTLPPTERTEDFFNLVKKGFKKFLIVMEEEVGGPRAGEPARYYRNYQDAFKGLTQVFEDQGNGVVFRVFTHEQTSAPTKED